MSKKKILIVEDQTEIIDLLKTLIDESKWDVTIVENFESAKNALAEQVFDIVLTDFNFPGGDGNKVAMLAKALGNPTIWLHTGDPLDDRIAPTLYNEIYGKLSRPMIAKLKVSHV